MVHTPVTSQVVGTELDASTAPWWWSLPREVPPATGSCTQEEESMPTYDHLFDDLAMAMRMDDYDSTSWLDTVEAKFILLSFNPDVDLREPRDNAPEWQREQYALALRIVADPERYRRVEGSGTPGRLRAFLRSIDDHDLRADLEDAARGGRGAYRRVRGVLQRRGIEQLWFDFEKAADREMVLEWLEDQGLIEQE